MYLDVVGNDVGSSDFALEDLGALEIRKLRMLESQRFMKSFSAACCVRCRDRREESTFQIEVVIARDVIQLT